eukprot:scaffold115618_cov37-Tisochrysis_lutea.AAC.2
MGEALEAWGTSCMFNDAYLSTTFTVSGWIGSTNTNTATLEGGSIIKENRDTEIGRDRRAKVVDLKKVERKKREEKRRGKEYNEWGEREEERRSAVLCTRFGMR